VIYRVATGALGWKTRDIPHTNATYGAHYEDKELNERLLFFIAGIN
jgi:hypothetical protein